MDFYLFFLLFGFFWGYFDICFRLIEFLSKGENNA